MYELFMKRRSVRNFTDRTIPDELIEKLLEVRSRLIKADLGDGIETPYWSAE